MSDVEGIGPDAHAMRAEFARVPCCGCAVTNAHPSSNKVMSALGSRTDFPCLPSAFFVVQRRPRNGVHGQEE